MLHRPEGKRWQGEQNAVFWCMLEEDEGLRVMRAFSSILLAITTAAVVAGCDRAKANKATGASISTSATAAPVVDQRPQPPAIPSKQLFQAIRISPDERKVRQLLAEHPELKNQEV